MKGSLPSRNGRWLAVLGTMVCTAWVLVNAQVVAPSNPRLVPNCAAIGSIKPLGASLPIGVNYTVTVTGCNFGSSTGTLHICNSATYGGTCADALGISWSSTSVSGAIRAGALSVGATVYLYVTDASANTNTVGLGPFTLSTGTYWVRTDGSDANDGTANTAGKAWQTITHAVNAMSPDDFARVQPGTFPEVVTPTVSGTSGHPITLVAGGAVTTCGLSFSTNSYIRIIGLMLDPSTGGCASGNGVTMSGTNTGLELWNVPIANTGANHGIIADGGAGTPAACNKCIILGGSVHNAGNPGSEHAIRISGNDMFIGYVDIATVCYVGIGPSGSRSRFVNINFSGMIQCNSTHPDFYYIATDALGWSTNLVEANYGIGTVTASDNKYMHAQNDSAADWTDNVWRNNVAYQMGAGFFSSYATVKGLLRWRYYHNTITYCDMAQSQSDTQFTQCGALSNQGSGGLSASIFNNIFFKAWGLDIVDATVVVWDETLGAPTVTKDYNLAYSPVRSETFGPNWTGQAHPQTNVNPNLVSVGTDFHLSAGSGTGSNARGTGGPLTTANGNGSSSTSLTVATGAGSFFIGNNASNLAQYSGALVPGDFITVGSTTVQVSSVSGDVLTLATAISWSNGDPVYFGTSSVIDIGCCPYKAGGYTLSATKAVSGGVVTITPNDASLVRFVVCYNGKVPYVVDNVAPYTCPISSGPFEARVYPRYASQTRWVTAQ